jgi:hypothetical protein
MSSKVEQSVVLSNINPHSSSIRKQRIQPLRQEDTRSSTRNTNTDTTGLDMLLSSHGSLTINLLRKGQLGRFTRSLAANSLKQLQQLSNSQFVHTNMFDYAKQAVEFLALQPPLSLLMKLTI